MDSLYFNSSLALYMQEFVAFKKGQDYDYTSQATRLYRFDQFLQKRNYPLKLLNIEIITAYIEQISALKSCCRANYLGVVREFTKYLHTRTPESCISFTFPFKVLRPTRFHLYTNEEICKLMNAATKMRMRDKVRPFCMRFLIGLLSCTGLRIDEALSLTRADVDLVNQRLFIKKGKFGKQRYVPLGENTVRKVQEWYELCKQYVEARESSPLFIDQRLKKLTYWRVNTDFTKMRQLCGLMRGRCSPRLHDFRHTYACNCILKWQASGEVNSKLPILATVLGHVNIKSTQIYLHISFAQLQQAAGRFEEFHTSKNGDVS